MSAADRALELELMLCINDALYREGAIPRQLWEEAGTRLPTRFSQDISQKIPSPAQLKLPAKIM